VSDHLDALVGEVTREPAQRQAGAIDRRLANDALESAFAGQQTQLQRVGVFFVEPFNRDGLVCHIFSIEQDHDED
jgi:hypothetical protein